VDYAIGIYQLDPTTPMFIVFVPAESLDSDRRTQPIERDLVILTDPLDVNAIKSRNKASRRDV
jgi:hypothetical protein